MASHAVSVRTPQKLTANFFSDGFDPNEIIKNIRQLYKNREGWHRFPGVKTFTSPLTTSSPDLESSTERKREEQQQTELSRCLKSSISTKNVKNQE